MNISSTVNIKELHSKTGHHVRRANQSSEPILITDHGKEVAYLVSANFFPQQSLLKRKRTRRVLPEYEEFFNKHISHDIIEDLEAIREER